MQITDHWNLKSNPQMHADCGSNAQERHKRGTSQGRTPNPTPGKTPEKFKIFENFEISKFLGFQNFEISKILKKEPNFELVHIETSPKNWKISKIDVEKADFEPKFRKRKNFENFGAVVPGVPGTTRY